MSDETATAPGSGVFVTRVAGVFGARLLGFVFGVTASLLMSRWLDRSGQGGYTTVTTLVSLLFTFGQFGLPSAVTFFASRGRSVTSLRRYTIRLTIIISTIAVGVAILMMPVFLATIARSGTMGELFLGLLALPILVSASLGGAILYGRRAIRAYTIIQVAQAASSLVAVIALVGILDLGVPGAIGAYLLSNGVGAVAIFIEVRRLDRRTPGGSTSEASASELIGYGARLYPSSITSYFNYRADVLLLNAMRVSNADIGLYGRAVNFAELLFYLPDSIGAIFYPTVAASSEGDAHRMAPAVARFSVLLAILGGLVLLPAAYLVILIVLPRFLGSLVPLAILLPGIVSLSLSKVLSSYISGLGRPGAATIAATIAMAVNVVANVWLIPIAGIAGAATASLISYSVHAAIMVFFASRVSGLPATAFVVPRQAEFRRILEVTRTVADRFRQSRGSRPA